MASALDVTSRTPSHASSTRGSVRNLLVERTSGSAQTGCLAARPGVVGLDAPREVQLPVGAPVHIQQPVTFVQRVAVSAPLAGCAGQLRDVGLLAPPLVT